MFESGPLNVTSIIPPQGKPPVQLDAVGLISASGGSLNVTTYAGMTVLAGNALIVFLWTTGGTANGAGGSVLWGAQAMTYLFNQLDANGQNLEVWGLLNPTPGNQTVTATLASGATSNVSFAAISYSGVNSTFGSAFLNAAGNANAGVVSTPATVTIPSAPGHAVVGAGMGEAFSASITMPASIVSTLLSDGNIGNMQFDRQPGAASVVVSADPTPGTDRMTVVAVDVSP